ncbi:MAG TPA: ATP-binding protein [Candidatus Xenobia bacterium]
MPDEAADLQRLVLDLEVHQRELAAQNEALRDTQEMLLEARQRYETLYQLSPVGYLTLTRYGVVEEANTTALVLLDRRPHLLLGRPLLPKVRRQDRQVFHMHLHAALGSDRSVRTEVSFLTPDRGSVRVQLLSRSAADRPGRIYTALIDLTEANEAHSEQQALLRTTHDSVLLVDGEGRVTSANDKAQHLFGWSDSLVGRRLTDLIQLPTGERDGFGMRADGSRVPLQISSFMLPEREHSIVTLQDLTDREKLQRQLIEVVENHRRQLGRDLHDGISQQLAGLSMLVDTLAEQLGSSSHASSARRIRKVIQETLQQSRELARNQYPEVLERRGLPAALRELARGAEELYGIPCEAHIEAVHVEEGMAIHLYRIAQETVGNAMRHAHPKKVMLSWSWRDQEGALEIIDDGGGFDPEQPGAGMGLRILQQRAAMIGSRLRIEPRPEGGTRVTCRCPLAVQTAAPAGGGAR